MFHRWAGIWAGWLSAVGHNVLKSWKSHLDKHAKTSASTVATYISGLSHIHKLNGFDDPTKSFVVSKILEGFKRENPGSKDLRMPVSSALLKQLINSLLHVYNLWIWLNPDMYVATVDAEVFACDRWAIYRTISWTGTGQISGNL
jgi:hypothetical protein